MSGGVVARDLGRFEWKRRMGVHEAYHQNPINRIVHWVCIPLELWAAVKLLSLIPLPASLDLALLLIGLIAPIYLLTEWFMGAAMVAYLFGCWWSARGVLLDAPWVGGGVAAGLFAVSFAAQVAIGHRVFERGRDDTEQNLAEFARTKNPIPILLVFYYHLVEVFLAAGYRPRLARTIDRHTQRELESLRPE